MLASTNEYMAEAARTIFEACTDEEIRKQCDARERYERNMRRLASLEQEKLSWQNENTSLQAENTSLQDENTSLQDENTSLHNRIAELEKLLKTTSPE